MALSPEEIYELRNDPELLEEISISSDFAKSFIAQKVVNETGIGMTLSVDKLLLNIESEVKLMRASGMSKREAKNVLLDDFDNDGRIFGEFKNGLRSLMVKAAADSSDMGYQHRMRVWDKATKSMRDAKPDEILKIYGDNREDQKRISWADEDTFYSWDADTNKIKEKPLGDLESENYQWITVEDSRVCPDCRPRHGNIKLMKDWELIGIPRSGWSVCKSRCRCVLEYTDMIPDGIEVFIRKK